MTDIIEAEITRVTQEWTDEAQRRRAISKIDPVADALEHCATDLAQRIENARIADGEWVTVEGYAALPDVDVTPQTVRAWIRSGQLAARPTTKGYLIKKDERRTIRRRTA